jgi:PKHD-type hydroxylase
MKGEWCFFKNYLDAKTCDSIVEVIKRRPAKDATLGVQGVTADPSFRRSNIRFVNEGDTELSYVFDTLWKTALIANKEWFDFHITNLDYFQVAEYKSENKGEYKKHQDVFWINQTSTRHRKLSCIIQLSDPTKYEGGDLELYNLEETPKKEDLKAQGTIIFFPSFVYHAALPVTKGTRYSIAAWFEGPKWR